MADRDVIGVLCFLEADWPLIGGSFTVNSVHVTWPQALFKRMVEQPVNTADVDAIHTRLAATFPPARAPGYPNPSRANAPAP